MSRASSSLLFGHACGGALLLALSCRAANERSAAPGTGGADTGGASATGGAVAVGGESSAVGGVSMSGGGGGSADGGGSAGGGSAGGPSLIPGEPDGFGIDPSLGGPTLAFDVGGFRVLRAGGEDVVLVGPAKRENAALESGLEAGYSIQRVSPSAGVLWSHWIEGGVNVGTLRGAVGAAEVDESGNVYVMGSFSGQLRFGAEVFESVVNPGSPCEGNRRGEASHDVFFAKLDPDGNPLWLRRLEGVADQWPESLLRDSDGSLVLLVNFSGRMRVGDQQFSSTYGSTGANLLIARFDEEGALIAARQHSSPLGAHLAAIDSEGNIVVSNVANSAGDLLGDAAFHVDIGGWIMKFDSDFEPVWARGLDEVTALTPAAIAIDLEDNIVVVGDAFGILNPIEGDPSIALVKVSPDGDPLWSRTYPGNSLDFAGAVAVLSDNSIALTGGFLDTLDFGAGELVCFEAFEYRHDMFVARIDENGEHLMSLKAGGPGFDYAFGLASLPGDALAVAGLFQNVIDFGSGAVTNRGGPYLSWIRP